MDNKLNPLTWEELELLIEKEPRPARPPNCPLCSRPVILEYSRVGRGAMRIQCLNCKKTTYIDGILFD